MRTFIAIDLDTVLKTNLAAFIDELRPLGGDVRWIRHAGMHLTLKFLGEVAEGNVGKISGLLEETAANHANFNLRLIGTGVFPPGKRAPRVLWIGIVENPQLLALQADVELGLESLGFEREKRDYHPHLTIGRVKTPSRIEQLLSELARSGDRSFGEMNVRTLTLFQSTLRPSGAEYHALAEFKLR